MRDNSGFDQGYAEEQLRRSKHPLRRMIKDFYLKNILADVTGPTVDIGCGAGQLLAKLPTGSIGLEVNPFLIEKLAASGLAALRYDIEEDDFGLSIVSPGIYKTISIAHVLEHFDDAANALRKLIASAKRLGVDRVIIVVPGRKGFESDKTHKTFVDRRFFEEHKLENIDGYQIVGFSDFPFPTNVAGKYFVYQELKIVYGKTGQA